MKKPKSSQVNFDLFLRVPSSIITAQRNTRRTGLLGLLVGGVGGRGTLIIAAILILVTDMKAAVPC